MSDSNRLSDGRLDREQEFHDRWAEAVAPDKVLVDEVFSLPTCPENRFLISRLGSLQGKKVLDLGTGLGEAAVFFAKQGADVTAIDISPGMLALCEQVAALHGVSVSTQVMSADELSFPESSFDIVYGANVLHHVDTKKCLKQVRRILRPGGKAAFFDPVKYNPVINVYRRMANQVRTSDEHPLGLAELREAQSLFSRVETGFFWIATLLVFLKFYFVDRIHPNQARYWKKIINDYSEIAGLYQTLAGIDRLLTAVPLLKWWSWNIAIVCHVEE